MNIIEDSRQKKDKHSLKHEYFEEAGICVCRSKLPYGDYALMPTIAIDTKQDIYELAADINQDHARFRNELIGAKDNGCQLYILVENLNGITSLDELCEWEETLEHFEMRKYKSKNRYSKRISGRSLARACMTMEERYGAKFLFAHPEDAGKLIVELLGGTDG